MLYSEFVKGTGCKDTKYNYKVYKDLEILYMNSDLSKEDIYQYGRKLVDNSKTDEQLVFEAKVKAEIEERKYDRKYFNGQASMYRDMADSCTDREEARYWRSCAKHASENARKASEDIKKLRWVLEDSK